MTSASAIALSGGWSPQQENGIKAVRAWLKDPFGPQVFRLFGFAGTGKTTLAKEIAQYAKGLVLYAAFTGKAALQLRKKGCGGASTLHSLLYKVEINQKTGEATFELDKDSRLSDAALLIVDEVSMVDELLGNDVLSFKKRVLVLGDPAQLRPVRGEGFFINSEPDVMLTEVHRQALDNPIIHLSMEVRQGIRLRPGHWGDTRVVRRADLSRDELRELVVGADQVLCGMNKTRTAFNSRIRDIKGLVGDDKPFHPAVGDRLICLRNNREKALFNGGIFSVDEVANYGGNLDVVVKSQDEERSPLTVKVFEEFFNGTENSLDWRDRKRSDEFTFGWTITCHKAQGSEWDNVLVFDESGVFRDEQMNWRYTAITRAAQRLTMVV